MDLGTLGWLFTILVFGALGSLLANLRSRPTGVLPFVLLAVATVIGHSVGTGTRLLSIFGFDVALSWALAAGCLGAIVGLLRRNRQLRRPDLVAPRRTS